MPRRRTVARGAGPLLARPSPRPLAPQTWLRTGPGVNFTCRIKPYVHEDWHGLPDALRGATVALGNFDGVHLGHAAVLRAAHAARPDLPLAALTFEPHPREHFRPDDPPFRLTLLAAKAEALGQPGARLVYATPVRRKAEPR